MSNNEQIIKEVTALAEQFESKPDAELLRQAYQKLESVRPYAEPNPVNRLRLRAAASGLWIRLLNLIDTYLSADFDPEDTVPIRPELPKDGQGQEYPPGTDPQTIRDPQERSKLINATADHRKAQERYRLQMHLYRINEQLTESARNYFVLAYQSSKPEQEEFRTLIQAGIKRADRKAEFLKFVRP
jgi:TfoX/Sxy family transcriptional regulator of competence genes